MMPACYRQSGCLEFEHFHDKVDAWRWLKPGAWGCKKNKRSQPKRRGFRPTAMGSAKVGVRQRSWRSLDAGLWPKTARTNHKFPSGLGYWLTRIVAGSY